MPAIAMDKKLGNHIANFTIGFFASLCAVFIPRMLAMLGGGGKAIQLFPTDYVVVGLIFSAIIGGVAAILEQAKSRTAGERFMSALGIPALLAGALNTGTATDELHHVGTRNKELASALQNQNGIRVNDEAVEIMPLQPAANRQSRLGFELIPSAYANDGGATPQQNGLSLGMQTEQQSYVIVLDRADNETNAHSKAETLRKTIPQVAVVKSGNEFLVIDGTNKMARSEAVLRAVKLKNENRLTPLLQQVK